MLPLLSLCLTQHKEVKEVCYSDGTCLRTEPIIVFFRLPIQGRRLQKGWAFLLSQRKMKASNNVDVVVVLEQRSILYELRDIANAFATLTDLLYRHNIYHPREVKYSFELIQISWGSVVAIVSNTENLNPAANVLGLGAGVRLGASVLKCEYLHFHDN